MELIADELVKVVYDKRTGILHLNIPVYNPTIMQQFEEPFTYLIDHINKLQVTRLLLNTSQIISQPSPREYKNIMGLFYSGLGETQILKMARIQREDPGYEALYGRLNQEIREDMALNFEYQNFTSREAAEKWLTAV